jgi:hypothetical protein
MGIYRESRGTGETTIGRALAHRLRGKFFRIDGTFIAGTSEFYSRVHRVFEAAACGFPATNVVKHIVAGIPHGGFYEGGRAQEANSFKARPYPPLETTLVSQKN